MYRYVAILWNHLDPRAASDAKLLAGQLRAASREWEPVFSSAGVMAFHSGAASATRSGSCETKLLAEARGVVLGRIFQRGHELARRPNDELIGPSESARIYATRGEHLISSCWGRYVALTCDPEGRQVSVLRDPTGGLPCYVTAYRDVRIVFSDLEACTSLGMLQFSINWKYIASYVPYAALQIRETGLSEVSEVLAGERLTFSWSNAGPQVEWSLLWKPAEIAQRDPVENPAAAAAALRETVRTCVHAWASLHRSVIHNLSGGLDSSIVLSCLKSAPVAPSVTCLHYFSPESEEDERVYAHLAANHMGAELVEHQMDSTSTNLEALLTMRLSPKPWSCVYDLLHGPPESRLLRERSATGVFSGAGGDGLFLQARSELSVADYLRRRGLRPGVLAVALDAACITRTSLWPILRSGFALHLKRQAGGALSPFADARTVIPREVREAARANDELIHPWIRSSANIPPGLLWQILCLSVPSPFYGSFEGMEDYERTAVLMSQPVMELCLRIPSYVWISGGCDRSIARRAFAEDLPAVITRRVQKGAVDRHNRMLLDANESFVQEMLLDGLLVRAGLLDREAVARNVGRDGATIGFEYNELLRQHLCTEVWLRRWSEAGAGAVAAAG